jgi:inhibitor of KinA
VTDVVPAYDTVGVYVEAPSFDIGLVEQLMSQAAGLTSQSKEHQIPVCYEFGEDLGEAAAALQLQPDELVRLHCSQQYTCYAVGFAPGFPYLGYLPPRLQGIPRRAEPRLQVASGSVAITGKQTGIYPSVTPGGWSLIGRTPLALVNLTTEFFRFSAGDTVQFHPISPTEFERLNEYGEDR